jgi:hypothetical protein
MAISNLFASKSISEHLLRGAVGFAAFYGAAWSLGFSGLPAFAGTVGCLALALFAMRGCPFCWSIGLINTGLNTAFKSKSCKSCSDASVCDM